MYKLVYSEWKYVFGSVFSWNWYVLVEVLESTGVAEVSNCVSVAVEDPFGGQKSFDADGSASMDFACANSNFSS